MADQNSEKKSDPEELGLMTLEERRHRADMALVHSTFIGRTDIEGEEWFEPASEGARNTRSTSDPLNVKRRHGRLELRKNFFTVRVTEPWNNIPSQVKQVRTKSGFKSAYAKCRGDISQ